MLDCIGVRPRRKPVCMLRCAWTWLLLALAGCGLGSSEESTEPEMPEWVSQGPSSSSSSSNAQLALQLRPGDRFPLRKIIEREVLQETPQGPPQVHHLQIELTLAMTVEDLRDGQTRFRVRYDRVRYTHHLPDEVLEFDSDNPPPQVPLSLKAWQAMVGDGFAFWIGRDNQIAAVEGFQEFLQRCLSGIPADRRDEVLLSIESTSGENGVSDFVDNAIGLLPYGDPKSPGDSWQRSRNIGRPVPMHLDNTYTLKTLDDRQAVIQISGQITPSTTLVDTPRASSDRVRMSVRQGRTWGECSIFRDTGLPQRSRVEHEIQMTVHMSSGQTFEQKVRGATTVESFPIAGGAATMVIGSSPGERTRR